MYTAAQKKAQNVLERNNFLIQNIHVIHSMQKCQEVKCAIYNLCSAISGRLQKYVGGIVVIQTVSHRDLTWSQLQSSSVSEPGMKWGLHFPSPPLSLYDYINVHKNIFVLNA